MRARNTPILVVVGLATAAVAVVLSSRSRPTDGQTCPGIPLPPHRATADLGPLLPEAVRRFDLRWTNDTGETFRFRPGAVDTTCGCTNVTADRTEVPPGASLTLTGDFATNSYQGPMGADVLVSGCAGGRPLTLVYSVTADVRAVLLVEPPQPLLDLGVHDAGRVAPAREFTVRRGAFPLAFDAVAATVDDPGLSVSVTPVDADTWRATFTLPVDYRIGVRGSLVRFIPVRHGQRLDVAVVKQGRFEARGPVAAVPKSLLFGAVPKGARETASVAIMSADPAGQPPRIVSAQSADGNITVEPVAPAAVGDAPRVNVTYTASARRAPIGTGTIDITAELGGRRYDVAVPFLAKTVE